MRMRSIAIIVLFFLLLLTWLLLSGLNLNSVRYDRELRALEDFTRFERGMNREVLTARAGLSRNYDALARLTDAYDDAVNRLLEAAGPGSEESAAIEALVTRARQSARIRAWSPCAAGSCRSPWSCLRSERCPAAVRLRRRRL